VRRGESFGTGSAHVRGEGRLWAVLFGWTFSRRAGNWSRHCCTIIGGSTGATSTPGTTTKRFLRTAPPVHRCAPRQASLPGRSWCLTVRQADEFSYDPIDGSRSAGQGLRILLDGDARIVF
jgi:phosphoglucomutase